MSASFATRGLLLTEHEFSVPLDHSRPDGEHITVFGREVADSDPRFEPVQPGDLPLVGGIGSSDRPGLRIRFDGGRIDVRAEFLSGVEDAFARAHADLMIAVIPPAVAGLVARELAPLPASLVARADHPLARGRHAERDLDGHLLLTVRGSDPRLELSTARSEARSTVHLNDFASKRAAILAGIGYGWMPDALIAAELASGKLRRIRWSRPTTHVFRPHLYHRDAPGPAARQLIGALAGTRSRRPDKRS